MLAVYVLHRRLIRSPRSPPLTARLHLIWALLALHGLDLDSKLSAALAVRGRAF